MENKAQEKMNGKSYYESLITKDPVSFSWDNPAGFRDGIYEDPGFVEGISDEDKPLAIIAAYNKIEKVATYKRLCKITGMTRVQIREFLRPYKQQGLISLAATYNEDTGLLNGSGWIFN